MITIQVEMETTMTMELVMAAGITQRSIITQAQQYLQKTIKCSRLNLNARD